MGLGQELRIVRRPLVVLASVFLAAGGTAGESADVQPASAGILPEVSSPPPSRTLASASDDWDERHMESEYRSVLDEPLQAPKVEGEGRYQALRGEAQATPGVTPPSTLPTYTQRTWESGTYDGPGKRTRLGHGPRAGSGGSALRSVESNRHKGKPPGGSSGQRQRRSRSQ